MSRGRARGGALPAALSALALLAGCGSSGNFAEKIGGFDRTTSSATVGAGSSQSAGTELSPAAAARFVNLRADDFPYLEESDRESGSSGGESQKEFEKCVGEGRFENGLASAESPSFSGSLAGEFVEFDSNVEVFGAADEAERDADFVRGHRVYSCLNRLLQPALEEEEGAGKPELLSVTVRRLRSSKFGVPGVFGYRILARIAPTSESQQLTAFTPGATPDGRPTLIVYMDILAFVSGRVEVALTANGSPRPVPPILERNLLRLLRERAEEADGKLPPVP